jgi:hypothetical protein
MHLRCLPQIAALDDSLAARRASAASLEQALAEKKAALKSLESEAEAHSLQVGLHRYSRLDCKPKYTRE